MKKLTLIFFISMLFSGGTIYSQGFQIDMSFGSGPSLIKIHHDYPFKIYDSVTGGSFQSYFIGLTNKIRGKFFLRTEMGFIRSDLHLRIDYNYLGYGYISGRVIKSQVLSVSIHNERIYIGILPEFRHSFKKVDFFINAGILLGDELVNTSYFSDTNVENEEITSYGDDGKAGIFGYSTNCGLNYNLGSIALKLNLGGIFFNKANLFNTVNHPEVSYRNISIALGVVYSTGK